MTFRIGGRSTRTRIAKRLFRDLVVLAISQAAVPVAYSQAPPPVLASKPVDLKVLVLTGNGTEPSFAGIQVFLNDVGIPHDDIILAPAGKPAVPLPALSDANKGFYEAVILATGNLSVCDAKGTCASALSDAGWAALDTYSATFGIRTVSYYTFPNPRYGLALVSTLATTTAAPGALAFAPAAAVIFNHLNLTRTLPVTNAYVYLATPSIQPGESVTPLLTMNGSMVGVYHRKADGREYVALTLDNNPYMTHSLALSYDLINWVTKGVFLGSRQAYSTPQVDDLFLSNDLFDLVTPGCKPGGFLVDPTVDLSSQCQSEQVSGDDLRSLAAWQDKLQASPQTKGFTTTMAFNGVGAVDPDTGMVDPTDEVVAAVMALSGKFFWVSHTFNHINLDCYNAVPNSGVCKQADAVQSAAEIDSNLQAAKGIGLLNLDTLSMVTPEISGLTNPNFVRTAAQRGVKYLIVDSSTLTANPPPHNTGIRNNVESSILMIPRRPTSIFYNVTTADTGAAGSLVDEYNSFYGPQGLFRIGGPGGPPFYPVNQTYAQIIDHESDSMLIDMLRFKADPVMFHQSNLVNYDGVNSLFTDLMSATLKKFTDISNLPVTSLPEAAIGALYQERMDYNASGVQATWYPGSPATIKLTTTHTATIPITGFCAPSTCPVYGGQAVRKVQVPAGTTVTIVP